VFRPRSTDGTGVTVLAGTVLSGGPDEPIGRRVRVLVGGREAGLGSVTSRYRFATPTPGEAAYSFEGVTLGADDVGRGVVLKAV
jgi:hypothetical protein